MPNWHEILLRNVKYALRHVDLFLKNADMEREFTECLAEFIGSLLYFFCFARINNSYSFVEINTLYFSAIMTLSFPP